MLYAVTQIIKESRKEKKKMKFTIVLTDLLLLQLWINVSVLAEWKDGNSNNG